MNMFKPVKPTTVEEYLASVPPEREELVTFLHEFIQKAVPELEVHFAYNMIGYGSFEYTNYKKEEVMWPMISMANQKNYVSVYVSCVDDDGYIAEKHADELGKVSVGKSCIRIKKLEDLNLDAFEKVLKLAPKNPGL